MSRLHPPPVVGRDAHRIRAVARGATIVRLGAAACALVAASAAVRDAGAQVVAEARSAATAQAPTERALTVAGMVLEAGSGLPVPGAQLRAESLDDSSTAAPLATARADADGRYRLRGLSAGRYRLRVRALGYAPVELELRLQGATEPSLWIGMQLRVIHLTPVTVAARRDDAFGTVALVGSEEADALRIATERARAQQSLTSDVRALTAADVVDAVTLAEPDLFRALQRLPGVSTRDDYSAELWTRGAPWTQTAVLLDGVPLFNPLHAAGGLSAVGPDQLGGVVLEPGVQSAAPGGGAAGRIAITTRPGDGATGRGAAELSAVGARVGLHGAVADGRGAWAVSARRSHVDLVSRLVPALGADSGRAAPYAFGDLLARGDWRLRSGQRVEASGSYAWDVLRGSWPGVVEGAGARWAGGGGRLSHVAPFAGGIALHTLGGSRLDVSATPLPGRALGAIPGDTARRIDEGVYRLQPTRNAAALAFAEGRWERDAARDDGVSWLAAGWRVSRQWARYHTVGDWPRAGQGAVDDTVRASGALTVAAGWVETRWRRGDVELHPGLRVEVGGRAPGMPAVRAAPRLAVRWTPAADLALSAGVGRTWQYAQSITPIGPGRDAIATAGLFWTVADEETPAVRADVVTVGAERWLGDATVASVTAYARRAEGMLVPSPHAGALGDGPAVIAAGQRARGVEVGVRRLAGRWTGSLAYARQHSTLDAAGLRFVAPWERPHLLHATGAVRVGGGLRVGGAFTHASGAPFTPFADGAVVCSDDASRCWWTLAPEVGEASSARLPAYRALDLGADWSHDWSSGRSLTAFVQVKNALGWRNRAAYLGSGARPMGPCTAGDDTDCGVTRHQTLPGLRVTPAAGLRVAF